MNNQLFVANGILHCHHDNLKGDDIMKSMSESFMEIKKGCHGYILTTYHGTWLSGDASKHIGSEDLVRVLVGCGVRAMAIVIDPDTEQKDCNDFRSSQKNKAIIAKSLMSRIGHFKYRNRNSSKFDIEIFRSFSDKEAISWLFEKMKNN